MFITTRLGRTQAGGVAGKIIGVAADGSEIGEMEIYAESIGGAKAMLRMFQEWLAANGESVILQS